MDINARKPRFNNWRALDDRIINAIEDYDEDRIKQVMCSIIDQFDIESPDDVCGKNLFEYIMNGGWLILNLTYAIMDLLIPSKKTIKRTFIYIEKYTFQKYITPRDFRFIFNLNIKSVQAVWGWIYEDSPLQEGKEKIDKLFKKYIYFFFRFISKPDFCHMLVKLPVKKKCKIHAHADYAYYVQEADNLLEMVGKYLPREDFAIPFIIIKNQRLKCRSLTEFVFEKIDKKK